jgi:hypothetical protein
MEVDKSSVHRSVYGRVKIAARDITKVSAVAKGAFCLTYMTMYEREVVMEPNDGEIALALQGNQLGPAQPSPKKLRSGEQSSSMSQVQPYEITSQDQGGGQSEKQVVTSLPKICVGANSAPPKISTEFEKKLSSVSSEKQRLQYKVDVEEMCTLNAGGDRVQGLFGEGISISEEEMISD